MQAGGHLDNRSKYRWPKIIYCICQPNELKREIKKNWKDQTGAKQKSGGPWPTQPPHRIAAEVVYDFIKVSEAVSSLSLLTKATVVHKTCPG